MSAVFTGFGDRVYRGRHIKFYRQKVLRARGCQFEVRAVQGLYCRSDFLGRKVRDVNHFDWSTLRIEEYVGETKYTLPSYPS